MKKFVNLNNNVDSWIDYTRLGFKYMVNVPSTEIYYKYLEQGIETSMMPQQIENSVFMFSKNNSITWQMQESNFDRIGTTDLVLNVAILLRYKIKEVYTKLTKQVPSNKLVLS